MVGLAGFEPTTTRTPSVCATKLRYSPIDWFNSRELKGYQFGKAKSTPYFGHFRLATGNPLTSMERASRRLKPKII